MTKIFSNRFFQGGIAITAIACAFFAYQNMTSSDTTEEAQTATTTIETSNTVEASTDASNATSEEGIENNTAEAVNNTIEANKINTVDEETTNQQ